MEKNQGISALHDRRSVALCGGIGRRMVPLAECHRDADPRHDSHDLPHEGTKARYPVKPDDHEGHKFTAQPFCKRLQFKKHSGHGDDNPPLTPLTGPGFDLLPGPIILPRRKAWALFWDVFSERLSALPLCASCSWRETGIRPSLKREKERIIMRAKDTIVRFKAGLSGQIQSTLIDVGKVEMPIEVSPRRKARRATERTLEFYGIKKTFLEVPVDHAPCIVLGERGAKAVLENLDAIRSFSARQGIIRHAVEQMAETAIIEEMIDA
jgi:hypothetical protein